MGPNGLGIARSLGREGVPVVGADFSPLAPGLRSRYCTPLITPDPAKDPQGVLVTLLKGAAKLPTKGILYPTHDAYVWFVSRYRVELSRCFLSVIPSEEVIESAINKGKQYRLAEQTGIPYPVTHYPESLEDVERIKHEVEYPAFIKPYYSHIWADRFTNKGFKVDNATQLVQKFGEALEANLEALVQSVIVGPDSNIFELYAYMSEEHEAVATFVTRKLRQYPNDFGVGTCMISTHDEDICRIGVRFLQGINYRGLGSIEFKVDSRDGKCKFLELNARLGHHNIQSTYAGINFPLIQYADLTDQRIGEVNDYKEDVKWLDAIPDFRAFRQLNRRGRLSLADWVRSILQVDCHAYLAIDDIKPFMIQYSKQLVGTCLRLRGKFTQRSQKGTRSESPNSLCCL